MAEFMNVRAKKIYCERTCSLEKDYFKLYRFREENVQWLADYIVGENIETRGGALTPKKQMEIFLRFLSDPGFQIGIGKEEGVHRSTVCKVITTMLQKSLAKAHLWIKFPKTQSDIKTAQEQWYARFKYPFGFGAIDCTHIAIQKPPSHGDEYVNRKGYFSINVQATCNANEEFTSIDAQWPGSVHDSRILKQSKIFELMNRERSDGILLGDAGYGIRPWLLTPYKSPSTPEQINYNVLHIKSRIIIERMFGQLKRRFPILKYTVRVHLSKIPAIIICCAMLHNISKYLNDPLNDEPDEANPAVDDEEMENSNTTTDNHKVLGERRRHEITNILYTTI